MSEVLRANSNNDDTTHAERASAFIGSGMSQLDRDSAATIAASFADTGTPFAKTAVLIPVAAHQDGAYVLPTMAEYARQKTTEPFTVFLHLNAPNRPANLDAVARTEDNVDKARELFPNLDIRTNTTLYDDATIGKIRRDLWNAAFLLAHHEHGFSSDVIGINNDIDTHSISPHYVARVQQHYKRQAMKRRVYFEDFTIADNLVQDPAATRVTHAVLPSHPNTGKVTSWVDNTYFQAPGHIGYEAGLVLPFSYYAERGGFNKNASIHETGWSEGTVAPRYLTGAHLYTSPRRYIDRLREHDSSEIWTSDSFGTTDACRESLPPDISTERAEKIIFDRLDSDILLYWLPGVMPPIELGMEVIHATGYTIPIDETIALATTKVEKQLSKAERLLRTLGGSALLADIVHENYNSASYATRRVTDMRLLHQLMADAVRGKMTRHDLLLGIVERQRSKKDRA